MRKLVSLGAVLLFIFGISFLAQPAVALPLCDCEFCSFSPNSWCWDDQWGFRFRCYEYTSIYCFGLNAPAAEKVTTEPAFFPLELLGTPSSDGRLCPGKPILKPTS